MTPRSEYADRRLTSADMLARYNIAPRTLHGWIRDAKVGLPPAIVIQGRRYWPLNTIEAWEMSRMSASASEAA